MAIVDDMLRVAEVAVAAIAALAALAVYYLRLRSTTRTQLAAQVVVVNGGVALMCTNAGPRIRLRKATLIVLRRDNRSTSLRLCGEVEIVNARPTCLKWFSDSMHKRMHHEKDDGTASVRVKTDDSWFPMSIPVADFHLLAPYL